MIQHDDERLRLILDEFEATREQMRRTQHSLIGELAGLNFCGQHTWMAIFAIIALTGILSFLASAFLFIASELFFTHDPWLQKLLRVAGAFSTLLTYLVVVIIYALFKELRRNRQPPTPVNEMGAPPPSDSKSRSEGYSLLMEKYRREAEAYRDKRRLAAEMQDTGPQMNKQ